MAPSGVFFVVVVSKMMTQQRKKNVKRNRGQAIFISKLEAHQH